MSFLVQHPLYNKELDQKLREASYDFIEWLRGEQESEQESEESEKDEEELESTDNKDTKESVENVENKRIEGS